MRVGFDATLLRSKFLTGVEKYVVNLLWAIGQEKHPFSFIVFIQQGCPQPIKENLQKSFDVCILPSNNRLIIDQFLLPTYARKREVDLMHFPVFGASPFYRGKHILTIHDATFWKYPETISKGGRFYYKPLFGQSIKRASTIITVSNSSKEDICCFFPDAAKKVKVIHEALDIGFEQLARSSDEAQKPFVDCPYILSVGTLEPRKNLKTFVEAFIQLKQQYAIPHKLVLTGRAGWLDNWSVPEDVKDEIIFTGYVTDQELVSLYKSAALYVFPSIYEGFGFPLLEAMICGIPIIASKVSSLPEIGGEACLYVTPTKCQEWVLAVNQVFNDRDLTSLLIEKGKERVQHYSWSNNARDTITLYREALHYIK